MRKYQFILLFQIVALLVFCALTVYLFNHELYFSATLSLSVILFTAVSLYRSQLRMVRLMERFISSIRYSDFTVAFQNEKSDDRLYKKLYDDMNSALGVFREKYRTLETGLQYYSTMLRSIDYGILVIDPDGKIQWINDEAKKELGIFNVGHVSELAGVHPDLPDTLMSLYAGNIRILHLDREESGYELIFSGISMEIRGQELLLVSLKNIQSVLDKKEIESWQKLIRVLTHEIMNTITPIISLSETVTERMSADGAGQNDHRLALQVLETIHRRSKGLLQFVGNYRKLTRIPAPHFLQLSVESLFGDLKRLFGDQENIKFNLEKSDMSILTDSSMVEQVLINLVKNAQEAIHPGRPLEISITATYKNRQPVIEVCDNGRGIMEETLDKIFIPFYTTKTSGSGIGLSLCRQMMLQLGGTIGVSSKEGVGSRFTLGFGNQRSR